MAVVRVEQLYPWPKEQIAAVLARYAQATEVVWAQEEPANMGAWDFVRDRLGGATTNGRTFSVRGPASFGVAGHGQPYAPRARAGGHPRKGARVLGSGRSDAGQAVAGLSGPGSIRQ